jgi:archaemetzincin
VLDLVPIFLPSRVEVLERLSVELEHVFLEGVRRREPGFDPSPAFDPERGQYSSTRLLRMLLDDPNGSDGRVLGVAGVDLFAPVLTYVFGEAQLQGRSAVVSVHRLRPEAYGLPEDGELLFQRLLKESVHELGHTFGLVHCQSNACVMRSSTYVENIDLKPATFCEPCLTAARASAGAAS